MSIRKVLGSAAGCTGRYLWGSQDGAALSDLLRTRDLQELRGMCVLVAVEDQLAAARALIELDGVAARMILCPPDISRNHFPDMMAKADVNAIVSDQGVQLLREKRVAHEEYATEWILLTSGTTGAPKMLAHTFASLTAAIKSNAHQEADVVWGTFYDIRRYGGLQIFLRALLGQGSFVLSNANEPIGDHLRRLGAHSVTHLTGTPSHWRRALMSPSARAIAPRYVRLSGEIADQAILNSLRSFYPEAAIGHAFASTEAGVGFEVNDGLEGFPHTTLVASKDVEMKVVDDSLRIRSSRTAARYIGEEVSVADADGFVDTGDIVERRGDRFYFLGRRSGVINVGGQKVYPEEVEALINRHPDVRMSCVRPRRSPITGALVIADVVLKGDFELGAERLAELRQDVLSLCRETLPRHKVPTSLRFVSALDIAATGKMTRGHA